MTYQVLTMPVGFEAYRHHFLLALGGAIPIMATQVSLNMVDYSNEPTSTKIHVPTLTGANMDAQIILADAWRVALEAISLCNERTLTAQVIIHQAVPTPPTNVQAQREFIVRVFYRDNTNGRAGSFTIPGPDLSLLTIVGDEVDITAGTEMVALVTASQAMKTRDGNALTVTRAIVSGRAS